MSSRNSDSDNYDINDDNDAAAAADDDDDDDDDYQSIWLSSSSIQGQYI